MLIVLDTSALIAGWRPGPEHEYAISAVSIAELQHGVLASAGSTRQAARLRRLSEVEHEFEPISFDGRVARSYAECAHAITQLGRSRRPRAFDLVIAATAVMAGASLATLNPEDFRGLEGLVDVLVPPTQ